MAQRIREYIEEIERKGGLVAVTESGWLHREISNFAYKQQKAIENGEQKIVGVNHFPAEKKKAAEIEVFRYPETAVRQTEKLARLRKKRDQAKLDKALGNLREKCLSDENIMPYVKEAVLALATLGEIEEIFREEFGLWQFPLA